MMAICTTETAATVGSNFHSRYCSMAICNVERPGPTRNSDISRSVNETMNEEDRGGNYARADHRRGHAAGW